MLALSSPLAYLSSWHRPSWVHRYCCLAHSCWYAQMLMTLLGLNLIVSSLVNLAKQFQTFRIRFQFNDDSFEVVTKPLDDLFSSDTVATGENFAVGGANVWKYDSFVNYEFFPSEALPILVCTSAGLERSTLGCLSPCPGATHPHTSCLSLTQRGRARSRRRL